MLPPIRPFKLQGEPGNLRAVLLLIGGSVLMAMGIDDVLHRTGPEKFVGVLWGGMLLLLAANDIRITRRKRRA
jgi:hypothetical protein